jgi:hypothetical protein
MKKLILAPFMGQLVSSSTIAAKFFNHENKRKTNCMKPMKPIVIIVAGLLLALPTLVKADASASISVGAIGNPPLNSDGSACAGTALAATVNYSFNAAFDSNKENSLNSTNYTLSADKGSISDNNNGTGNWSWTPGNDDDGKQSIYVHLTGVSFSGTNTSGNPITWSAPDASALVGISAVHAIDQNPCTINPPSPSPKAFPLGDMTMSWQFQGSEVPPFGILYYWHHFTGSAAVTGTESYENGVGSPASDCGGALDKWYTPSTWSWGGSIAFNLYGAGVSFTLTGKGPQISSHIFDKPATPYKRWYGKIYDHMYNPTTGSFTGSDSIQAYSSYPSDYGQATGLPTTVNYTSQNALAVDLSGNEYKANETGATCSLRCCPSN